MRSKCFQSIKGAGLLLFTVPFICVFSISCKTAQNACIDCRVRENPAVNPSPRVVNGCPNCDRATNALAAFEESLIAKDSLEALAIEKKGKGPANPRTTIQIDHAQEYIGRFMHHSPFVKLFMGRNYRYSFSFDTATLGAFASLYCQGKIDGVRAYVAKYDANPDDSLAKDAKNFTIILVGTRRRVYGDSVVYEDVLIPTSRKSGVFADLQDYSNPCKPSPCPGSTLPTMTLADLPIKR